MVNTIDPDTVELLRTLDYYNISGLVCCIFRLILVGLSSFNSFSTSCFTKANRFEIGPFLSLGEERQNLFRDCIPKCP
jgi:hypothetical protein